MATRNPILGISMADRQTTVGLRCGECGSLQLCGPAEISRRLGELGMLKREKEPDPALLIELAITAAGRLCCRQCGVAGLAVAAGDDLADAGEWDDDWPEARTCSECGAAIAPERLELFPDVKLCAACQRRQELAGPAPEPSFCPRCGAVMELRATTRGGLSRYALTCPECRKTLGP